jgi:hypothetical protein
MICSRFSVADLAHGAALRTVGFRLRMKAVQPEDQSARWSAWVEERANEAEQALADAMAGRLTWSAPLAAAMRGIEAEKAFAAWLRDPSAVPEKWTSREMPQEPRAFPLRTAKDLAIAAGLAAVGWLPHAHIISGPAFVLPGRLPEDVLSLESTLRELENPATEHPVAYAAQAAANWQYMQTKLDPSKASALTFLLRGTGTRSAIVSRELLESSRPYIEVPLPDGQSVRIRNRFRDQVGRHLRGLSAAG